MRQRTAHPVASIFEAIEQLWHGRMINRSAFAVSNKILLTDIGNVARVVILSEQVIEWLIAMRPDLFRDRFVPFLAVSEDWIDIEYYTAKIEHSVPNDIADSKS